MHLTFAEDGADVKDNRVFRGAGVCTLGDPHMSLLRWLWAS